MRATQRRAALVALALGVLALAPAEATPPRASASRTSAARRMPRALLRRVRQAVTRQPQPATGHETQSEPVRIVVANRGPFDGAGNPRLGGLVTAVLPMMQRMGPRRGVWVHSREPGDAEPLAPEHAGFQIDPVELDRHEVRDFYGASANEFLWPFSHTLPERVDWRVVDEHASPEGAWKSYEHVNTRYAAKLSAAAGHAQASTGDEPSIWVHDYHFMLTPGELRTMRPEARVGYFHHIPMPTARDFRRLPRTMRRQLVRGLLGSDLVGFQATWDVENFLDIAAESGEPGLSVDRARGEVHLDGRTISVRAFPIGIDAENVRSMARDPSLAASSEAWRQRLGITPGMRVMVGVSRLDYTKGLPETLRAYRTMLRQDPSLRGRVKLVQVAPASRADLEQYRAIAAEVSGLVDEINTEFGDHAWQPVTYVTEAQPLRELVALFRVSDVGLIAPLRDGQNLVAHEFVASQDGRHDAPVLVLSQNAGAAEVLTSAVHVDPYQPDSLVAGMRDALEMPQPERTARMTSALESVSSHSVHRWQDAFLHALEGKQTASVTAASARRATSPKSHRARPSAE